MAQDRQRRRVAGGAAGDASGTRETGVAGGAEAEAKPMTLAALRWQDRKLDAAALPAMRAEREKPGLPEAA